LNHFFREWTFGDEKTRERVTTRFADYPDHTKFDMVGNKHQTSLKESQQSGDGEFKSTYYFMKLVPHIFNDFEHDEDFESYSYSLTSNRKVVDRQHDLATFITFDIAPVSVMITKEK